MNDITDDVYAELQHEFALVKKFLTVIELQETRDSIRDVRPIAMIRDQFGPIRKKTEEYVGTFVQDALQMVLVLCVSRFELFLRTFWQEKVGPIKNTDWKIFSNMHKFVKNARESGLFPSIDEEAANEVQAVIQKRHVVVHRGGRVDAQAIEAFEQTGSHEFKIGDNLQLYTEIVRRDINILESFISSLLGA